MIIYCRLKHKSFSIPFIREWNSLVPAGPCQIKNWLNWEAFQFPR